MNESLKLTMTAKRVWTCPLEHNSASKPGICTECGAELSEVVFAQDWDPEKNEAIVAERNKEGKSDFPVNPSQ